MSSKFISAEPKAKEKYNKAESKIMSLIPLRKQFLLRIYFPNMMFVKERDEMGPPTLKYTLNFGPKQLELLNNSFNILAII